MSLPTQPAYIHTGTWDDETRKHPAMDWMEKYTLNFNKRGDWDQDECDWFSSDFTLVKPDGTSHTGNTPAFAQSKVMYQFFTQELHEPYFLVTWETADGWDMIGQAWLYANLPGTPTAQEQKVKDLQGKEWDVKIPGAFKFEYVRQEGAPHDGIVLRRTEISSESFGVVQILMARGVIKA